MEKCGEELLDDLLNVTAGISASNRRLSARFEEAINTSSVLLRPSVLDKSVHQITIEPSWEKNKGVEAEKEKGTVVRNKRKAEEDNPDPEVLKSTKNHKMSTMEEKMDEILNRTRTMVTKADVDKIAKGMNRRLGRVEEGQDALLDRQNEMDKRLKRLERDRGTGGATDSGVGPRPRPRPSGSRSTGGGAGDIGIEQSDSKSYELARRQIILTPVASSLEAGKTFMERRLGMVREMVDSLSLIHI